MINTHELGKVEKKLQSLSWRALARVVLPSSKSKHDEGLQVSAAGTHL